MAVCMHKAARPALDAAGADLLVVRRDDANVSLLHFDAQPRTHQRLHVAEDHHCLVRVEPRGRVRLALVPPLHALEHHRHARLLQAVPRKTVVDCQRIRLALELAIIEERIRKLKQRRMRPEVPLQFGEDARVVAQSVREEGNVLVVDLAQHQALDERRLEAELVCERGADHRSKLLDVAGKHQLAGSSQEGGHRSDSLRLDGLPCLVNEDDVEVPALHPHAVQLAGHALPRHTLLRQPCAQCANTHSTPSVPPHPDHAPSGRGSA
jgi:hypothetical protein